MERCRLHQAAADAVVAQARDRAPAECCGVLLGRADEVLEAVAVANESEDPNRFRLNPQEHVKVRRDARTRGLEVVGFNHSHPHSAPIPSPRDLAEAAYPDSCHVIVGLAGDEPELRAFTLRTDGYTEIAVVRMA